MAKRKRRKPSAAKPVKKSTPRRPKGMFWGDGLLAFFYFLQAFFLLGGIGLLACIGFDLEFSRPMKGDIIKNVPDPEAVKFINELDQVKAIGLAVVVVGLIPIVFFFLRAITRANRVALLIAALLEGVNVWLLLSSTKNEARFGAVVPIIVVIYALLRVGGGVGPKIR